MSGILQMWMGCEICRPQAYSMYVGGSQSEADRRRSISPNMPLTDQEKRTKNTQETKQYDENF
jgi:hypothetical protein